MPHVGPKRVTGLKREVAKFSFAVRRSWRTFQVLDGRPRETSFPFISGDTYRALADVYFDLEFWKRYKAGSRIMPRLEEGSEAVVFVECILLRDRSVEAELIDWVRSLSGGTRLKIVFANGDEPPHSGLREFLVEHGHLVFSHNLLDGEQGVTPIPLGLQNATHHKFGVTFDFLLQYDEFRHTPVVERARDIRVYGNFSDASNLEARKPLKEMLTKSRFGFFDRPLSVRRNRAQILRAKFVPSPAGLGPDCYRTWEALYLGAIPVLKKGTIAESITADLPIWVVSEWEELMDASDGYLDKKFGELSSLSRAKSMFPFWHSRILS